MVLGSGFVAAPVIEYLQSTNNIIIGSADLQQAEDLASRYENTTAMHVDASKDGNSAKKLEELVSRSDVVISLLPQTLHIPIAKHCMQHRKDLVTASYTSPLMKSLHNMAVERGVTFINEMGLDPGLDHMSALKIIREVQNSGGTVNTFSSVCGGLPAPDAADNPLGYKFSWNPLGVLMAAQNPAKYLLNKKVVQIPGDQLLRSVKTLKPSPMPVVNLSHIPNRDCLHYLNEYGIPDADSIYRGTIRYGGFCEVMEGMRSLGLLDQSPNETPEMSWPEYMNHLLQGDSIEARLGQTLSSQDVSNVMEAFDWLGMFDKNVVKQRSASPIESICPLLSRRLVYQDGEDDLVVMHHGVGITTSSGAKDYVTSSLVCYGDKEHTAMARTVGYPVAVAAQKLLDGHCKSLGVVTACHEEVWSKVLPECENLGITFKEKYGQKQP